MMNRRKNILPLVTGILVGMAMSGPAASAATQLLTAQPTTQTFYINGQPTALEAYSIQDRNYVKLIELGEKLGIQVTYQAEDNSVHITTQSESTVQLPTDGARYIPQAGDTIQCDDGTLYTITDVERYDTNVFASGPVGELPDPTCDWTRFDETALPPVEVRHFTSARGETLWVRNLYETRRMQYTIYNALGNEPTAWKGSEPLAHVSLTIPEHLEALTNTMWPWRASEVEELVQSRPVSQYYVEAWDYYLNGVFQYTRYCIASI